ncbi:MAG TPA: EAL domain-containing protein, partial [Acidimicrobiales bacterium]|nr:EAL domain-containing protein [Acidimicrobiales bacterium]
LTLEADLRRAIDEGQLEVFFQPVVSLDTGLPTGAEALVRWHHPTRGLLRPADFIPAAEESGLIVPLGQWVYRCAMEQVAAWDADPAMPQLQTIAVNLSSQQLRERRLSLQRQQVVHDTGIDRRRICVEVTETVAMDNSPATRRTLDSMHRDGLQIAIDDFGTGYSSLAYLKSLPVTTVKIDRRFVADLGASPESGVIVAVIVDMARHLGLQVVAEGVETEEQRAMLTAMGAGAAQGFLWSKPLPAVEFADWWARSAVTTKAAPANR